MVSQFYIILFMIFSTLYITTVMAISDDNCDDEPQIILSIITCVVLICTIILPQTVTYNEEIIEVEYTYKITNNRINIYYGKEKVYNNNHYKVYNFITNKDNNLLPITKDEDYFGEVNYSIDEDDL